MIDIWKPDISNCLALQGEVEFLGHGLINAKLYTANLLNR